MKRADDCAIRAEILGGTGKHADEALAMLHFCRRWTCGGCAEHRWSRLKPWLGEQFKNGLYAGVSLHSSNKKASIRRMQGNRRSRAQSWERVRQSISRAGGSWVYLDYCNDADERWILSTVPFEGSVHVPAAGVGPFLNSIQVHKIRGRRACKALNPLPDARQPKGEWVRLRQVSENARGTYAARIVHKMEEVRDRPEVIDLPKRLPGQAVLTDLTPGSIQLLIDATIHLDKRWHTETRPMVCLPSGWENMNVVQLLKHGVPRVSVERLCGMSEADVLELWEGLQVWESIEQMFG